MAAMSQAEINKAARFAGREIFVKTNATCTINFADLQAAISAIDAKMESLVSTWTQAQTGAQNLNAALPAPSSSLTLAQKAILLAAWAIVKYAPSLEH